MTHDKTDICLVSMPYAPLERPSLGLSLLSAAMKRAGFQAVVFYESLRFAEKISLPAYTLIANNLINQIGEWSYAAAAGEGFASDLDAYLELLRSPACTAFLAHYSDSSLNDRLDKDFLIMVRKEAEDFAGDAAARITALKPVVVGCTSQFQQHNASLALLKRIKSLNPAIVTILGGSCCDGRLALTVKKLAPWVDYVFSGESDEILPRFYRLLCRQGHPLPLAALPPGIIAAEHLSGAERKASSTDAPPLATDAPPFAADAPITIVNDLDSLPDPDFEDFYTQLDAFAHKQSLTPMLTFETARGCWWYERSGGCTFCTLTPHRASFRSKSAARVLAEIERLRHRYENRLFMATDDILDSRYYDELLPKLAALDCLFFFELKANINEKMMDALSSAGARFVQAGIESLHDEALKAMNKGTSALNNIHLLKLALEKGVRIIWHILHGLPQEKNEWYEEMAGLLPLLFHLQPPDGLVRLHFDRFSRYTNDPDRYGLVLSPHRVYSFAFPVPPEDLPRIAYFFEDKKNVEEEYRLEDGRLRLRQGIKVWQDLFPLDAPPLGDGLPRLVYREINGATAVTDTRPCAVQGEYLFKGVDHFTHQACRKPASFSAIVNRVAAAAAGDVSAAEVASALDRLTAGKIVISRRGFNLSLATREPEKALLSFSLLRRYQRRAALRS